MANRLSGLLEQPRNRLGGLVEVEPTAFAGPPAPADLAERPVIPRADPAMLEATQQMLAAPPVPEAGRDIRLPFGSDELNNAGRTGLVENTKKAFARGGAGVNVNFMFMRISEGTSPEERQRLTKEAQAARREFKRRVAADPIQARNWAQDLYLRTVEITGPMVEGLKQGAAVGTVAAGTAAVAGQLGPQVAFPEEIVTVPGAFAAGSSVGAFKYWADQGRGEAIELALEAGLDIDKALYVGAVAGPLYGAVEFSQVGRLLPGIKTLKKGILKIAMNRARAVGANVVEEGIQKAIVDGTVAVGEFADGKLKTLDIPEKAKEVGLNAIEEMKASVGPMALLSVPGAGIDIANTSVNRFVRSQATGTVATELENLTPEERQAAIESFSDEELATVLRRTGTETGQLIRTEQEKRAVLAEKPPEVVTEPEVTPEKAVAPTPVEPTEAPTAVERGAKEAVEPVAGIVEPTAPAAEGIERKAKAPKFASELKPKPLADADKQRRREILQARLKRGEKAPANLLAEFEGEVWTDMGSRPLVNPKASAIQQDKQVKAQQAWDKRWKKATVAQPAPAAAKPPAKATKPPTKPNAGRPAEQATTETTPATIKQVDKTVKTDFTAIPPQTFSLRKEAIERERERLGLDGPESANKESFRQWQKEAQEDEIPEKATRIAEELLANPRALSPKEIAGLGIRLAEVTIDIERQEEAMKKLVDSKADDADIANKATDINRLEADRDLLIQAAPEIQKAAGRGLVALKMTIDRSFNLTAVLTRATTALRKKLSSVQKALFTRLTKENEALSKRVEELRKLVSESKATAYIKTRVSARQLSAMSLAQKDANLNRLMTKLKSLKACAQ